MVRAWIPVTLALLFAGCGGKVLFVAQEPADGGQGGASGQGGAAQGTDATATVADTASVGASTGSVNPSCTFPAPVGALSECADEQKQDTCSKLFCDSGDPNSQRGVTCVGSQCTCDYMDLNTTTSCSCTASGDVCGGAPSCCPF